MWLPSKHTALGMLLGGSLLVCNAFLTHVATAIINLFPNAMGQRMKFIDN